MSAKAQKDESDRFNYIGDSLRRLSALNDGFSTKAILDDFISTSNRFSSLHQRERQTAPLPSNETPVRTTRNPDEVKANQQKISDNDREIGAQIVKIKAHTLEVTRLGDRTGKQAYKSPCCEPSN